MISKPILEPTLVFDGVTVIDVERGTRIAAQRVIIQGNRITAIGTARKIKIPQRAHVIRATGKYLIPGLWDMHLHSRDWAPRIFYPMLIAAGVTGIRDAASDVPLDTLRMWRREILAGALVGPPRQLFVGSSLAGPIAGCVRSTIEIPEVCVTDEADARHLVDSLKTAGADMIKTRAIRTMKLYYAIAAEARRIGIPLGGHVDWETNITAIEASDSGATLLDHINSAGEMDRTCIGADVLRPGGFQPATGSVDQCRPIAVRFVHNKTWFVPTLAYYIAMDQLVGKRAKAVMARFSSYTKAFWADSIPMQANLNNWLHGPVNTDTLGLPPSDSIGIMRIIQRVGLPVVTGTDVMPHEIDMFLPGFMVHAELATLVAEGLTPLAALQAATLNPAKVLRATDSLGTVAPGKLADLILLDADPLADITNTTTILAVVANGRYFNRTALDQLLTDARKRVHFTRLM